MYAALPGWCLASSQRESEVSVPQQHYENGIPSPNSPSFNNLVVAAEDGLLYAVTCSPFHILRPLFHTYLIPSPYLTETPPSP